MDQQTLMQFLVVAVVANIVVIAVAIFAMRRSRGDGAELMPAVSQGSLAVANGPKGPIAVPPDAGDRPHGASVGVPTVPSSGALLQPLSLTSGSATMADEDVPQATATATVAAPEMTTDTVSPTPAAPALGPAGPLIDPGSGLPARIAWEVALGREEPRFARYRRLVSIVVVELDGLVALAERLGQATADRLIPPVATTLSRFARQADLVAQVDHGRFLLMLPETDEVAVINYIERVREACDMWLSTGAVSVRLAIGWASPPPGGTLADAFRIAEERMQADRRHGEGRGPAGGAEPR